MLAYTAPGLSFGVAQSHPMKLETTLQMYILFAIASAGNDQFSTYSPAESQGSS